ncbi:cardiolipin synthase [Hyunsoonleella sp. 2307UL5-6]|uniref:cardiolipin synthase n=1 Tax=Hyunsoonleella sp. 2307UL5-6 TaxID=3384768 RepID=UPI0039BC6C81
MISVLIIIYIIISGLALLGVIFYGARPSKSLSWLFVIIFMPYLGVVFYVLFGLNRRKIRLFKLKQTLKRKLYDEKFHDDNARKPFENFQSQKREKLATLISNNNNYLPYNGNSVELLEDGDTTFSSIFKAIKNAKCFIHIQYYILEEGELMDKLFALFKEKIKQGVEIRVMYDAIGSFDWKRKSIRRFKSIGVVICSSMPLRFGNFIFSMNYRNHRKIVIVDGIIGFTGGFNLTDKYIKPVSNMGIWEDIHLKISGPAVESLHKVFIKDYFFASKEDILLNTKYLPKQQITGNSIVQIVASGPDSDYAAIMQQYIMLINLAENSICIANPYFIPSAQVLTALKIAALSGVRVQILLPFQSDSVTAKYSMRSYFEELMQAGVEIYLKKNVFLHSKMVITDIEILSIGSGNFDNRSFDHNFETNALVYNRELAALAYKSFVDDCKLSVKLEFKKFKTRSTQEKFYEGVARFLSPLL